MLINSFNDPTLGSPVDNPARVRFAFKLREEYSRPCWQISFQSSNIIYVIKEPLYTISDSSTLVVHTLVNRLTK